MRTITTERHIYTWDELSNTAKERAAQCINQDHFWADDTMDAGIKEARADWEGQYSEESMVDMCEANGHEFTGEGELT